MDAVATIRRFNRAVTEHVGALEESYLARGRPLGEARILFEIGPEGAEVATLRERLRLDSAYVSRLLRSLEAQKLVETIADPGDGRRRTAVLTEAGRAERALYDGLSDDLARSFLAPLGAAGKTRLLAAMAEVERLLAAGRITLAIEAPDSADATSCLAAYFAELAARFEAGFDPAASLSASTAEMRPPAGLFLLARRDGEAVGCAALKHGGGPVGEVKRMWVAPAARGLGLARRLLARIEHEARAAGLTCLRLETNRALVEAQALYRAAGFVEVAPFSAEPYAHHWFEKGL